MYAMQKNKTPSWILKGTVDESDALLKLNSRAVFLSQSFTKQNGP